MTVHRAITQHDPTRPLGPWLTRITYNQCLKRLAKSRRIAEMEVQADGASPEPRDPGGSPEEMVAQRQVSETVDSALDRLSAQDRGIIVMRYREGFTDTEIAEAVSMPVGTVKTRLFRARAKLKKFLAPFFREVVS
jgi:RNA polymerase sigma-70 factor (ECF subfamily)